jgi:glyoxylase-like metal-dependent hydrolase (beta-lactamase superfamily II)
MHLSGRNLLSRRSLLAATATVGAATILASLDPQAAAAQGALKVQHYVADDGGFRVTSVILTGEREAILVDAQFTLAHAHRVVADLLAAGKVLTTAYITHAHPDHYFGIEVIKAAFPGAKIVATPAVLADIEKGFPKKIADWGPKLGPNAPARPTLPQPLAGNSLALEGHAIEIIGPVQGDNPNNTMLWVPALKALIAGDTLYGGTHVWTASSDKAERQAWLKTLQRIEALQPQVVVPGHLGPGAALTLAAVAQTRDYLTAFDEVAGSTRKSAEIIKAMTAKFPQLALGVILELGAKVAGGDMPKWD